MASCTAWPIPQPGHPENPAHLNTHKELVDAAGFIKNKSISATIQKEASRFLFKK